MSRPPVVAPLVLLAAYAFAAGLLAGGTDLRAGAGVATFAFALCLGAGLLAYGAGRLASRDPDEGWVLSKDAARLLLGLVAFLTFLVHVGAGLLAPVPMLAGWLAGRRSAHASDALFLGALGVLCLAIPWHREAWDDSSLWIVPALLAAVALLAREAWDLGLLRREVEEQRRSPVAGGAPPGPRPGAASTRALAAAGLVLLAGALLALALGLLREGVRAAYAELGAPHVRSLALVAFVVTLGGVLWLLARRPGETPPA